MNACAGAGASASAAASASAGASAGAGAGAGAAPAPGTGAGTATTEGGGDPAATDGHDNAASRGWTVKFPIGQPWIPWSIRPFGRSDVRIVARTGGFLA